MGTRMRIRLIVRSVGSLLLALLGYWLGLAVAGILAPNPVWLCPAFTLMGALGGYAMAVRVVPFPLKRLFTNVKAAPLSTLMVGAAGLILGLIVAALLAVPLSKLPSPLGVGLPFVVAVWAGLSAQIVREGQVFHLLRLNFVQGKSHLRIVPPPRERVLLDTSAIIDGRTADVATTGFVSADLVVPKFVLAELRHIADSSDGARRVRCRRGFEALDRLRLEKGLPFRIAEDATGGEEVDPRFVAIAKAESAAILTTDFNLNRTATSRVCGC